MEPTNTSHPDYFHRVVDCQWACPTHTDVPEYIRLVAQGEYTEAYLLNRKSNVFPGILGRVCDRPCEPACRRGRLDEKPVAICRLKRVAADYKGDIKQHLQAIPKQKNGKKIALVGAGPASLTVANDLLPLGYEVVIYEQLPKPGGLMRTNIPAFRLPVPVLDDEINTIIEMGADLRLNTPVESLKDLLEEEYDAVFVGSGAPIGRGLEIPGRYDSDRVYVGISWLEEVAFGHINSISPRVVIIGGGNTAMDCCRTAKRIGGTDIKVVARKPYDMLRASDWELEETEEEAIDIITNHAPKRFIIEDGVLTGVEFVNVSWSKDDSGKLKSTDIKNVVISCDAAILAVGQENSFPFIERDIGMEFDEWGLPVVDKTTFQSTIDRVFFGGDAAFGPLNIIWAVAHGHEAAVSIDRFCQGKSLTERLTPGLNLVSQRMGLHQWSYSNDWDPLSRRQVPHMSLRERFVDLKKEVETGFDPEQALKEAERCLNCDAQTDFNAELCIECDACIDVCPVKCLTMTANGPEAELRQRLSIPANNTDQNLFVSHDLPQTGRVMVKDEDVCIHCGLCAERCPTAAWDMKKSLLEIFYAGQERNQNEK
ncbi:MAG: FAD-dependent oxidoreductase [Spirochaetales bacterium]|jgi:formate dehydrogenase (NADP+) beta subunit|nr:FAD-dependent oxidoreductase [Spirochaetales bacterium]